MKIHHWLACIGVAALVGACGGDEDEGPAAQPAEVNKQAAAQTAQGTISALTSATGENAGQASASSLASVAMSSQNLIQASPGATTPQSVSSGLSIDGLVRPLGADRPGCTCTATSCTFSDCDLGMGGGQYSFKIDGSYSWGDGHVQCKDLKYTFGGSNAGAGASAAFSTKLVVTLNCDVTVTSTMIKGFIHSVGSSSTEVAGQDTQAAYSSNWDVKVTYNDVTFGDSKQPTGGSMRVEGTTSVNAGGQSQAFAGTSEMSFPIH